MKRTQRALRSAPYVLAVGLLAAGLAYYFLSWLPSQRQYFLALRYRTLAIVGNQISAKVEKIASSLQYALDATQFSCNNPDYLENTRKDLYPTVAKYTADVNSIPSNSLLAFVVNRSPELIKEGAPCFLKKAANRTAIYPVQISTTSFREYLSKLIRADIEQDELEHRVFDDILIADADGNVLFQAEQTTPRIGHLNHLLDETPGLQSTKPSASKEVKTDGKDGGIAKTGTATKTASERDYQESHIPEIARTYEREFGDSGYYVLVQPARVDLAGLVDRKTVREFFAVGLIRTSEVETQAKHLPSLLVYSGFAVTILAGFCYPFLKLQLVTPLERLSLRDVFVMMTGLALVLFVLFAVVPHFLIAPGPGYRALDGLANRIRLNAAQEFVDIAGFLQEIVDGRFKSVPVCLDDRWDHRVAWKSHCNVLSMTSSPSDSPLAESGWDLSFLADGEGTQQTKWTTHNLATPKFNISGEADFRAVQAGKTWHSVDKKKAFYVDPQISPTTAEMIVALSMPQSDSGVAVLLTPPRSLVRPVIPRGFGFAVFREDGTVLFHSTPQRALRENFLEECPGCTSLMAPISDSDSHGHAVLREYRGELYAIRLDRFSGIEGSPWWLAVFARLEPLQSAGAEVISLTFSWTISAWAIALLCFLVWYVTSHIRGSNPRSSMWKAVWICANSAADCWPRLVGLTVLFLIESSVIYLHWWVRLDVDRTSVVRAFWVAAPSLALITAWTAPYLIRWRPPKRLSGCAASQAVGVYTLLVLLFAGLPVHGLYQVQWLQKTHERVKRYHAQLAEDISQRREYFAETITSSPALDKAAKSAILEAQRTDRPSAYFSADGKALHNYYSERFQTTGCVPESNQCESSKPESKGKLWITAQALRGASQAGEQQRYQFESSIAASMLPEDHKWKLTILIVWLSASIVLCFAMNFYGRRLFRSFEETPLPEISAVLSSLNAPQTETCGVLLVGVRGSGKDTLLDQELKKADIQAPYRVKLRDARYSRYWVPDEVSSIESAVRTTRGADVPKSPVWVHLSNLEVPLASEEGRGAILDMMERLFKLKIDGRPVRLAITSAFDPMVHFADILSAEREAVYADARPELNLQRWSDVLSRLVRVRLPGGKVGLANVAPGTKLEWERWLLEECNGLPQIEHLGVQLKTEMQLKGGKWDSQEQVRRLVGERAEALYESIWSSCHRREKLVLIQIAQTGLLNPSNSRTFQELLRLGLVKQEPNPQAFNETFRRFLDQIERSSIVREWEQQEGQGAWITVRNIGAILSLFGICFLAYTQGEALQQLVGIAATVVGPLAGIYKLIDWFFAKRAAKAAVPQEIMNT